TSLPRSTFIASERPARSEPCLTAARRGNQNVRRNPRPIMKRLLRQRPPAPLLSIAMLLALCAWTGGASAQRAPASKIEVVQLRENFYVIGGAGGNVVVQIGPEGVIL